MQEPQIPPSSTTNSIEGDNIEEKKELEQLVVETTGASDYKGKYLQGWRRHLVSLGCCICMFLVNVEVSIVGTALVPIVEDLKGVERMGWVITGYLITYTATIIIWAKLSDIFGRKYTMAASLLFFTAFSGACGASQNMTQLIVSRVFQGIGAAGCWSIGLTMGYELVPRELYPIQGAMYTGAGALGSLTGPLIGGGTSQHGQWRWAFLFNTPVGAATILLLVATVPAQFPHQGDPDYHSPTWRQKLSIHSLARLDIPGCFLLLAACMTIVAVLLEGGISIAWNSGAAIALFVVSGIVWIAFLANEWFFTKRDRTLEPIFPWRFMHNRAWMGTLIFSFMSGIPYNILIINIPQRFQDLDGSSPMGAAVRLIPFNLLIAVTCVLVNVFLMKSGVPCVYFLLLGSIIQVGGLAWFCVLPQDGTLPSTIYGCQIITGFGIGCILGITLLMPPLVVDKKDLAISSGALILFRALGGIFGLSITTTAFNTYLKKHLFDTFGDIPTAAILTAVQEAKHLPLDEQLEVRTVLSEAYSVQMKILVGFAALQVLAVALVYRKGDQIKVVPDAKK
ncbi:MFS general substrate transporter [Lentithecium fluviatile CBS 122367]|uniref:MFS general substrate transporter n=1 Tax=Lentithecium fluviatile CBS 122367 TaxID=1168545 RepID=A0A6G1JER8_9PLEO|nr:MFS general substrate transporter [Lentithecium fluviatile CBS 122367]